MTTAEQQIAAYVDRKADTSRRYAKAQPDRAEIYDHAARVLDALADDIRLGLYEGEKRCGQPGSVSLTHLMKLDRLPSLA